MKLQNGKDHFAENFQRKIDTPIWNKLKVQKFKNFNSRSLDTGSSEIVYLPLSKDNEYLSGVLVAEKQADSAFAWTLENLLFIFIVSMLIPYIDSKINLK